MVNGIVVSYKEVGCKETWVGGLYMRRMVVRRQGVQWMDFLGVRQRFPCTGDLQPRLTICASPIMHMQSCNLSSNHIFFMKKLTHGETH